MKIATRLILGTAALLLIALLLTVWLAVRELTGQALPQGLKNAVLEAEVRWQLGMILFRVGAPLFAATLALYIWARHLMRPVGKLASAARRLSAERLHERLPISGRGDEFDELTTVFNEMTARLEQSFEQVREFTLNASHELKTPLTIMRADVEGMMDDAHFSEPQRAVLYAHVDEIDRMARLVDSLSFLTKADAQMIPLALENVSLDELVREAAEDAEVLAAAHHVTAQLGECAPTQVLGDRHRLRQVLLILCDNGVKYNRRDGTGRIALSLLRQDNEAVLTVINTGPTLDPDEQLKVFDRFYRGSSEQSRCIEGSGLGLSIVQWLVQQHGGKIACSSCDGETRFIIKLKVLA